MPTHRRASPPHTGDANQPKARPRGPWLIEAVSETLAWSPPNTQTLSQNELLSICFLISKGRTTTWINATTPGCQRHHSGDRGADRGGGGSTCPTQAPGGRHPQSWAHWEEAADLGPTASTWASFSLGTSPLPANGPPSSEATKQAPSTDTGNAHSSWSALRLEKDKHSHHPVHCPATCGGGGVPRTAWLIPGSARPQESWLCTTEHTQSPCWGLWLSGSSGNYLFNFQKTPVTLESMPWGGFHIPTAPLLALMCSRSLCWGLTPYQQHSIVLYSHCLTFQKLQGNPLPHLTVKKKREQCRFPQGAGSWKERGSHASKERGQPDRHVTPSPSQK